MVLKLRGNDQMNCTRCQRELNIDDTKFFYRNVNGKIAPPVCEPCDMDIQMMRAQVWKTKIMTEKLSKQ